MEQLIKPIFNNEIKVEIKGIGTIEDNIEQVNKYANDLKEYYENLVFNEDEIKLAKDEKSEVNKFKDKVATYRKDITKQWNEPISKFEARAKETEKILGEVYNTINDQVSKYESKLKIEKGEELVEYFNEYAKSKNIDFLYFGQTNINVTLSASMKSLKDSAKEFVDKIADDLKMIKTMEYQDEIYVEYKKCLNLSKVVTEVHDRHVAINELASKKEEIKIIEEKQEEVVAKVEEIVQAPEEIFTLTFTVKATRTKLEELNRFLKEGGYDCE